MPIFPMTPMALTALTAPVILMFAIAPAVQQEAGAIAPAAAAELLAKSDIASQAPESFRARLRISALHEPLRPPDPSDTMEIEVWCSGESRSLVRFLGPKEKGKYLLRIDDVVWFLAPGSKKPVKVSAAHRLRGSASLDEILGIRYVRDYVIDKATEAADAAGPLAVLELAAKSRRAPYPRVRYVVRRATGRPVRAEYLLRSGKISSTVEFIEWEPGSRPVARKLILTDTLLSNVRTEITLLEMDERKVPGALFDLADPSERRKLDDQ